MSLFNSCSFTNSEYSKLKDTSLENSSLVSENSSLVSENSSLVSENSSLVSDNSSLVSENSSLVSDNSSLVSENSSLVSDNSSLVSENSSLISDNSSSFSDNSSLSQDSSLVDNPNLSLNSITRMLDAVDSDVLANALSGLVIEAIRNKDKDTLKALFSKSALNEAVDLDGKIDYLFSYIKEGIISCEPDSSTVEETYNYQNITKKVTAYYNVITYNEKYFFLIVFYPIDTINQDNEGLYTLSVLKSEDKSKLSNDDSIYCAGIYKPEN
ncbi:MAG: DUF5104 domain-containing protein [Oscillospiraceae bacterium]|nr:DUF5104 domain-containing protein [Oscillospiraceae bacterium]